MQLVSKRTSVLTLSATLLGACATAPDKIDSAYVSPLAYEKHSCADIRAELERVTLRAQQLHGTLQERADNDGGKMFVGMVFFWPILFALEGDNASAHEYARLKGERDTLERLSNQKNCHSITIVDVAPGQTATQAAEQAAQRVAAAAPARASTEARLRELKELKDKGLVTDEIYRDEQRRILAEPASAPRQEPAAIAVASPAAREDRVLEPPGAGGLRPGDRWVYRYVDPKTRVSGSRKFEIEHSSPLSIVERVELEDGSTLRAEHRKGNYVSMVGGMQFSPYYFAFQPVAAPGPVEDLKVVGGGDPCGPDFVTQDYSATYVCTMRAELLGAESISVPAGFFRAYVVQIKLTRESIGGFYGSRVHPVGQARFWMSAESGRIIKAEINRSSRGDPNETLELVAFRAGLRAAPASGR